MPKTSPLYNLINSFSPEQLQRCGIIKKETEARSYFIIRTSKIIEPVLESQDLLHDAHFSIDQYYNMEVHGYTPIHYTLNYKDTVIHGYLNVRGEYKYYQISPSGLLSKAQEKALEDNIQAAMPVLRTLFEEQTKRQETLQNTAKQLDFELSNLSRTLDHKKIRDEYIKKARDFIEVIQELNLYSGNIDRRYLSMTRLIERIEAIYECVDKKPLKKPSLEKSKETKDDPQDAQVTPDEPVLSQKEALSQLFQEAMIQFSKSAKEFENSGENPDHLKENAKIVNENLLVLYSFPEGTIKKNNLKKISPVIATLKQFYESQSKTFTLLALAGDLIGFKAHFFRYAECIPSLFYESLIKELVEKEWTPKHGSILDICHFLNEHDLNYRNFILELSQGKGYPISPQMMTILHANKIFEKVDNHTRASLLFKLHLEDKKELFEAFSHHGADVNSWAIQSNREHSFDCFTLFYMIATLNKPDCLYYLKSLIHAGADQHLDYTSKILSLKNKYTLKESSSTHTFMGKSNPLIHRASNPLTLLSDNLGLEGLSLMIPKAPLTLLALHLGELIANPSLGCFFIQADHYVVYYADCEADANAFRRIASSSSINNFSCYLPYPNFKNKSQNAQNDYKIIYQKMQCLHEAIDQQLVEITLSTFNKHYEALFKLAKEEGFRGQYVNSNHFINTRIHFLGCELLVMKYAAIHFKDSPHEQRNFITKYSHELYTNIINVLRRSTYNCDLSIEFYRSIRDSFKQPCPHSKDNIKSKNPMLDAVALLHLMETEPKPLEMEEEEDKKTPPGKKNVKR